GKKVVFEQRDGALRVAGASADPAMGARAAEIRGALAELVAEGAASVGPAEKAQGFDRPRLTLTIEEAGDKPVEIRFGAGDSFHETSVYYARRADVAATFAVAQSKVRPLMEAVGK